MPRSTQVVVVLCVLAVGGCARSVQDRELDRVFAHQDWLRDSTVPIRGVVVDSAGAPVPGVSLSADNLGGYSDSLGRFEIPYQEFGSVTVVAARLGYLPDSVDVVVRPPDTASIRVILARAPAPCCSLTGHWNMIFQLDSPGTGQQPVTRRVAGDIRFSGVIRLGWPYLGEGAPSDPFVHTMGGLFDVDFGPFWGTQIAPDVSTSIVGPVTSTFANEALGRIFSDDSVEVDLIPRISHGGVSFGGRLRGDTMSGAWVQRAYCCGARGTVTMIRVSADPGPIVVPPAPPSSAIDTLLESERGVIRVRVWDEGSGAYLHIAYNVSGPTGTQGGYHAGEAPGGWGRSFWLPPGRYKIEIGSFLCGEKRYFLRKALSTPFKAVAGDTTDITLRFNTHSVKVARSGENHDGLPCS
jgi:hypothetical protein